MSEVKLPIWPVVGHAYKFVWRKRLPFLGYAALPFTVFLALTLGPRLFGFPVPDSAAMAALLVFHSVFSVAWMRYYLLGPKESDFRSIWSKRTLSFTSYRIVIGVSFDVLLLTVSIGGILALDLVGWYESLLGPRPWFLLTMPATLLFYGWFAVFSLGLPAISVDRKLLDAQIAGVVSGNVWGLITICALTYPLYILDWPISAVFVFASLEKALTEYVYAYHFGAFGLVRTVASFVLVAVLSVALAEAFKVLTGWPDIELSDVKGIMPEEQTGPADREPRYPQI